MWLQQNKVYSAVAKQRFINQISAGNHHILLVDDFGRSANLQFLEI